MNLKRIFLAVIVVLVVALCLAIIIYLRPSQEARKSPNATRIGVLSNPPGPNVPDMTPEGVVTEAEPVSSASEGVIWGTVITMSGELAEDVDVQLVICSGNRMPPSGEKFAQRSGHDGMFRFDTVPLGASQASCGIVARKGNTIAIHENVIRHALRHWHVNLILMPGRAVAGEVVNGEGAKITGAWLVPVSRDGDEVNRGLSAALVERSGDDGRFRWQTLLPQNWNVNVYADGYAPLLGETIEAGKEDLVFVLSQGQRIEGQILSANTGDAIASLRVLVRNVEGVGEIFRTKADENGRFAFDRMAPGNYKLELDDIKWALLDGAVSASVLEGEDTNGLILKAVPGARIVGSIRSAADNSGVPEIRVEAVEASLNPDRHTTKKAAVSDSEGEYEITGLSPGDYKVALVDLGPYAPAGRQEATVHVSSGFATSTANFLVERGGMIVGGIVVDERQQPMANAQVTGSTASGQTTGMRHETAATGADGRFLLEGFRWDDEVYLYAKTDTAASGSNGPYAVTPRNRYERPGRTERIILTADEIRDIEIEVKAQLQGMISGTVVDKHGSHAQATVSAIDSNSNDPWRNSESTRTDGNGLFALEVPTPSTIQLCASRSMNGLGQAGGPPVTLTLGPGQSQSGVRLVVGPMGLSIQGKVTDEDGRPIGLASVRIPDNPQGFTQCFDTGEYMIANLESGVYDLQASWMGYALVVRKGVPAGSRNIDFMLSPLPNIKGKVVNARDSDPITEFEVCVARGKRSHESPTCKRIVDPNGEFAMSADPDKDILTFRAEGYLLGEYSFDPQDPALGQTPITISLTPGDLWIDGIVQDENGSPVAGATVWASDGAPSARLQPRDAFITGEDGTFHLDAVPEKTIEVIASHSNYALGITPAQPEPDVPLSVSVVLSAGGIIEGTAQRDGQPLPGVLISIAPKLADSVLTDADGRYSFKNVPAGEYELLAGYHDPDSEEDSQEAIEQPAAVESGAVTNVDFVFGQTADSP